MIVSQSVLAVSTPCYSLQSDPVSGLADGSDPHAGHHMDTPSVDEASTCCEGGYCSVNGCLPLVALFDPVVQLALSAAPAVGPTLFRSFPSALTETPYRPPISR